MPSASSKDSMLAEVDKIFTSYNWKDRNLPVFDHTEIPANNADWDFVLTHTDDRTLQLENLLHDMTGQNNSSIRARVEDFARDVDADTLKHFLNLALNKNLIAVECALSFGACIDQETIRQAVRREDTVGLQLLLQHGWNINEPLSDQQPPALSLVVHDINLVSWFVSHGACPSKRCKLLNITPLSYAIKLAPLPVIQLMLKDDVDVREGELLHYVVRRSVPGQIDVLNMLFAQGADVNRIMYEDDIKSYNFHQLLGLGTALHEAAELGNIPIIRYLLAHGADTSIRNTCGELAEDVALKCGNHEASAELRKDGTAL